MGRKLNRTIRIAPETRTEIVTLFGTVKNAYARLSMLNRGMPFDLFSRVMKNRFEAPAAVSLVEKAWAEWKENPALPQAGDPEPEETRTRSKRVKAVYVVEPEPKRTFKFREEPGDAEKGGSDLQLPT